MPIWFELIALLLMSYGVGIMIGWALWGRTPTAVVAADSEREQEDLT